jgi:hypothetical protein
MDTSQTGISLRQQEKRGRSEPQIQKQLEEGLNKFRAEVIERPFSYVGIAFAAGFVSRTFPARLIFSALLRLLSFLSGPAILVLGILKVRELVSGAGDREGIS